MTRFRISTLALAVLATAASYFVPIGIAEAGKKFTVVHTFSRSDGAWPYSGVISDDAGNLYGTTELGGDTCSGSGCGTVFKIAPDGTETVLYSFLGRSDGAAPYIGSLIRDADGNLFGTTSKGGNGGCGNNSGCGTVFKIAPDGTETQLYVFQNGTDGATPYSGLVADKNGNLFGTAFSGGSLGCNQGTGCGVVYELTAAGEYKVLHSFTAGSDGAFPQGRVSIDKKGNLYGATEVGGKGNCQLGKIAGCGVVFQIAPDGTEKILYTFQGGTDGEFPSAAPIVGPDGALYGTAAWMGDPNCKCGTVYRLTLDGTLTNLHAFAGGADGFSTYGEVAMSKKGDLYGTTVEGGANHCGDKAGCGIVFKIAADGTYSILHALNGKSDGRYMQGTILIGKNGYIYGTGTWGGSSACTYGCGTVFRIKDK